MNNGRHGVIIMGTGSYAPERVMTNAELSKLVDTSDEWIVTRTGIRERRIAGENEHASDLGARAGEAAIRASGLKPEDIDAVIVGTMTGDLPFPATACLIQQKLGIPKGTAFDLAAACSGFVYSLEVGAALVRSGVHKHVLVIGSEKLSSILDWTDRTTCVLFGDAAGAVVLGPGDRPDRGILGVKTGADGEDAELLYQPAGGSRIPATSQSVAGKQHFLRMNGREVFKHAVLVMERVVQDLLKENGYTAADIDLFIPHQANQRIIDTLGERLKMPTERIFVNLERYGNTSAASIPLALDEAVQAGRLKDGDLVLFVAFGAGLTWGASLLRWSENKGNPAG
jgi:3-oxoacyl-[acyl-carrier-protein] synthase-3